MNEHERTPIEVKCLIICLHLGGTYDELKLPCLASMETITRRMAQVVEAYSDDGGRSRWAGVHHYEGRTDAMDNIDPNLRAAFARKTREELNLENIHGKFMGTSVDARQGDTPTAVGDDAAQDGTSTAKGGGPPEKARSRIGGRHTMTAIQASGIGTTAGLALPTTLGP